MVALRELAFGFGSTGLAGKAGLLAEQIHPFTGEPLSVMPLTWSHSAYVTAFLKYRERVQEFASRKHEPA
jgi:hypothetical protein